MAPQIGRDDGLKLTMAGLKWRVGNLTSDLRDRTPTYENGSANIHHSWLTTSAQQNPAAAE